MARPLAWPLAWQLAWPLFGLAIGLAFGLTFGLICGLAFGLTFGLASDINMCIYLVPSVCDLAGMLVFHRFQMAGEGRERVRGEEVGVGVQEGRGGKGGGNPVARLHVDSWRNSALRVCVPRSSAAIQWKFCSADGVLGKSVTFWSALHIPLVRRDSSCFFCRAGGG